MLQTQDEAALNASAIPHEMQAIVRAAAEPWAPGDTVKAAINRATRVLGLPHRRTFAFWYLQARAVHAHEADALRRWHRKWQRDKAARLNAELEQLEIQMREIQE